MESNQIAFKHTRKGHCHVATVLGQFIKFCEDSTEMIQHVKFRIQI